MTRVWLRRRALGRGIFALAEGLRENGCLRELKLANQFATFTQAAEESLADALEANWVLTRLTIDLRSTRAREVIHKCLQRNQDELRRARLAMRNTVSGGPPSSPPTRSIKGVNVADWGAEAARIASDACARATRAACLSPFPPRLISSSRHARGPR